MLQLQRILTRPLLRRDRRKVVLLRRVCPALVMKIMRADDVYEAAELLDELASAVNRADLSDSIRFDLVGWLLNVGDHNVFGKTEASCSPGPFQISFPFRGGCYEHHKNRTAKCEGGEAI